MKNKTNFTKLGNDIFYKYIYPVLAKEFLLGNNYEEFANKVSKLFILNPEQWEVILYEWEFKEYIYQS